MRAALPRYIIGPSFQLLSNWCSMGCAGCGIRVAPPEPFANAVSLSTNQLDNVVGTLRTIKAALADLGFVYGMVEQSGGEPTHHPQVVEAVGQVFDSCVHKIITNGLPTASIHPYVKRRGEDAVVVVSLDHQTIEFNRLRLGPFLGVKGDRCREIHNAILANIKWFADSGIPLVISTIISKWNISKYLDFLAWLEEHFPIQVQAGTLTPIPVSLVSFGNRNLGLLNPTKVQVDEFEEAVDSSRLLTVRRTKDWLLRDLVGHYRHKQRVFENGETLDAICARPSRRECDIFRYMVSFNFQDEEILRPSEDALFEGYACGVKVLGNMGYRFADVERRPSLCTGRPTNMSSTRKYYRVRNIAEYMETKDAVTGDMRMIDMGETLGYFSDLRRGMCMLDDFDGVWWPFNAYIHGFVEDDRVAEFWALFKNKALVGKLRRLRTAAREATHVGRLAALTA